MFGINLYGILEYGNELIGKVKPVIKDVFPIYSNKKDYYVKDNSKKTEPQDTYLGRPQSAPIMNDAQIKKRY